MCPRRMKGRLRRHTSAARPQTLVCRGIAVHQSFCMNCFAMMPSSAAVCPACGQEAAVLSSRDYREKLIHALHHPLADVRMRAVTALGLRRDAGAADDLVQCALRHPIDILEGLEVVKSLRMLPRGTSRSNALHKLCEQHPAPVVRIAAMAALANTSDK